jgi:hypothetical protein
VTRLSQVPMDNEANQGMAGRSVPVAKEWDYWRGHLTARKNN